VLAQLWQEMSHLLEALAEASQAPAVTGWHCSAHTQVALADLVVSEALKFSGSPVVPSEQVLGWLVSEGLLF
jgi:hypothetical protein